jgi:hypothetical protein
MDMGARSTDQWKEHRALLEAIARNRDEATAPPPSVTADELPVAAEEALPALPSARRDMAGAILLGVAAVLWIAAALTSFEAEGGALVESVTRLSVASGPLALLGIAYLLLHRTSRREARRFGQTAMAMRAETAAFERAMARLADRLDDNGKALAEQSERLLRLGEDSALRLSELAAAMQGGSETLDRQSDRLERAAATARTDTDTLLEKLPLIEGRIEAIGARIDAIGADSQQRAAALDAAVALFGSRAADAAGRAEDAAQRLTGRIAEAEQAGTAAESRIEAASGRMTGAIDTAYASASEAVEQTRQGIEAQSAAMLALVEQAAAVETRLGAIGESARTLEAAIAAANTGSETLAEDAGPRLVEALLRVRETAEQAAAHARETLAEIIPAATASLSEASRQAVEQAIGGQIEARMAGLATSAEGAIATAHKASDALAERLTAIEATNATIEMRLAEARAQTAALDEDLFAPRVALLIEALNSASIDVAKILSNDIADQAWMAYLKGDRSIFTRRSVRLVDRGEARDIARLYNEEPEFRAQVSRYIHDFEGMLRRVLANRDGAPLCVTLLSSDMGKLYVALAQAIQRLRT